MEIKYKDLILKPIGNILGNWCLKSSIITNEYSIKPNGYKHADVYKEARKKHCSVDVYEINSKLYIPCTYGFMGVVESNLRPYLKKCEEYSNWYKWARKEEK